MRYLALFFSVILSSNAFAGGGFLWLKGLTESVNQPMHVVTFILVCTALLVLGLVYRSKASFVEATVVPDKGITFRNLFEFVGEFIYNLARNIMGEKQASRYYPLLIVYFMLILMSNLTGLIPGFLPPTDNLNTTLGLGLFVFLYYNWEGIKTQGIVGHIKHFMGPVWYLAPLMLVLELISHGVRPLSLGLRLKGNMEGDHLVLAIFSDLVPYIIPIPFYVVGMFVCFMQAFVFTLLTMVYINLATETHDHGDHAH